MTARFVCINIFNIVVVVKDYSISRCLGMRSDAPVYLCTNNFENMKRIGSFVLLSFLSMHYSRVCVPSVIVIERCNWQLLFRRCSVRTDFPIRQCCPIRQIFCLFRQHEFKQLCRIRRPTLNFSFGTKLSIAGYFSFAHLSITILWWFSPGGKSIDLEEKILKSIIMDL